MSDRSKATKPLNLIKISPFQIHGNHSFHFLLPWPVVLVDGKVPIGNKINIKIIACKLNYMYILPVTYGFFTQVTLYSPELYPHKLCGSHR